MKILMSLLLTVILAPNILAQQPPSTTGRADWTLYPAGHLPPGKPLTDEAAAKLAGADVTGPFYLFGTFVVTASASDRAVMRTNGNTGSIRIVAIYPPSVPVPPVDAKVERDESHGFRIVDVRRGGDGQVTIYVQEITRP
jgi:hypothetical protein